MQTLYSLSELRAVRESMHGSFGLIPTMGALHVGHGSLVERARQECSYIGTSIFVNPTQFGVGEDFGKYPRTLEKDLDLFESLGADIVFVPSVEVIYPPGYQTWVDVADVTAPLEGKYRPGHFRGVTTVVAKLLNAFTPSKAYFGQKDAQQVVVLKRMVRDLNFPVELMVCPTVREANGLAMSSRNAYLNPAERHAATVLYRSLCAAKEKYDSGERNAETLRAAMQSMLDQRALGCGAIYFRRGSGNSQELDRIEKGVLLSLAVQIGKTRLIDNFLIGNQ